MKHIPRKRFGQNFLHNQQVIHHILQAINPAPDDNLLEIGPGLGAITQPLLQRLEHLIAVEIDRDLQQHLRNTMAVSERLQLIAADALTLDYDQFGAGLRVVGNLPYNISTPLLMHLLKFTPWIKDMHFMLQKEVVERIVASPGSKAYGRLSVMIQYHCEASMLFVVPPEAFEPRPKVDSAIIRLVPYQQRPFPAVSVAVLEQLVARAFAMRRKTITNNLKGILTAEQLLQLGIEGNRRPEQISIIEYVQLAEYVSN